MQTHNARRHQLRRGIFKSTKKWRKWETVIPIPLTYSTEATHSLSYMSWEQCHCSLQHSVPSRPFPSSLLPYHPQFPFLFQIILVSQNMPTNWPSLENPSPVILRFNKIPTVKSMKTPLSHRCVMPFLCFLLEYILFFILDLTPDI